MKNYKSLNKLVNIESPRPSELKLSIPGILAHIILTRNYYQKNDDLKSFTSMFPDKFYADYLFKSRPLLYSRLIKEFISIEDEIELEKYTYILDDFIFNMDKSEIEDNKKVQEEKTPPEKKNKSVDAIKSWGKLINPGRYNED